jgi:predicted transcriptional regulator
MLSSIQNKGGKIKPTHLMYSSNLSHIQMTSYLEELVEKSLIHKVKSKENNDYILITDTGSKFLEKLQEMKEFEKTFGL